MDNSCTIRFKTGRTYAFRSSPDLPRFRGGEFTVLSELKPTDQWGNRILLVDVRLLPADGSNGTAEIRNGARCFVEEGFATFVDSFGSRTVPTEIATLQGIYPDYAKGYAIDGIAARPA